MHNWNSLRHDHPRESKQWLRLRQFQKRTWKRKYLAVVIEPLLLTTAAGLSFKKADKLFQKKQFKQALKHIDGIVKKNEKYGEALALKGAILARLATNDDERADALDVCKRGVQLDLTSKMSWTHLARLYQVNMKYEDAARAYKMAIKLCNKPTQVYEKTELRRNLVTVLSQVRNWTELAELRRQMQLDNRDNGLVHWVGYL